MRIQILSVGEIKTPYLREGEADYIKRLGHYCKIDSVSIRPEPMTVNKPETIVLEKEGKQLLDRIPENSLIVVLDRKGKPWSSEKLAKNLAGWQNRGIQALVFVIGGPLGLCGEIIRQADAVLSLSSMTFPHELCKVVFLEQLYRAFTILKGEKYHK